MAKSSKVTTKKEVISKIENAKKSEEPVIKLPIESELPKVTRSESLKSYRVNVQDLAKRFANFALTSDCENLLTVKMGLMEAVRIVEGKMKENKD
jgi:hypothetical protein